MTVFDTDSSLPRNTENTGPHRTTVNRFEVSLWVITGVLVVGGLGSLVWAASTFESNVAGGRDRVVAQVVYSMAPSVVLAGLVAGIFSLAVRALLIGGFRRSAVVGDPGTAVPTLMTSSPASQTEGSDQVSAARRSAPPVDPLQFAPPKMRPRRGAIDHSAFKRPPAD